RLRTDKASRARGFAVTRDTDAGHFKAEPRKAARAIDTLARVAAIAIENEQGRQPPRSARSHAEPLDLEAILSRSDLKGEGARLKSGLRRRRNSSDAPRACRQPQSGNERDHRQDVQPAGYGRPVACTPAGAWKCHQHGAVIYL